MRIARKALRTAVTTAATGVLYALEAYTDLVPGLRLTRRRRIHVRTGMGILGAEIATWNSLAPSLVPHPWWAVAANTATSQAVGHLNGVLVAKGLERLGVRIPNAVTQASLSALHVGTAAITVVLALKSYLIQGESARLVGSRRYGARSAAAGMAVGTLGYGTLLALGEAIRGSWRLADANLRRVVPEPVAVLGATATLACLGYLISDKLVLRRVLERLFAKAEAVNRLVYAGYQQPWEPERSGSVWSHEKWIALGAQGRVLVGGGPRARDIAEVLGVVGAGGVSAAAAAATPALRKEIREPIRIYGGLVAGRSLETIVHQVRREIFRTGALRRDCLVIHTSTGTGWVSDWQVDTVEFLTGGNCATVSMQYSFVQSPIAYIADRDTPVRAGKLLIEAVLELVEDMENPPKVFVAGESLGAYGTSAAFTSIEDLLARTDGAVFSGAPRFTHLIRQLTRRRAPGSPERLPLVDSGRHVRFVAHKSHVHHDWRGRPYAAAWQHPRVAVVQFASDAIVWWDKALFYRQPAWLREPGSRGVPAPAAQHVDVVSDLRWVPFTTGWQVAVDMLNTKRAPADHGHNYRDIMVPVWRGVLGDDLLAVDYTADLEARIIAWITEHSRDTRDGLAPARPPV